MLPPRNSGSGRIRIIICALLFHLDFLTSHRTSHRHRSIDPSNGKPGSGQFWRSIAICALLSATKLQSRHYFSQAPDQTNATQWANGALLNKTLSNLQPGDILFIPNKTYHLMGGIKASGLTSVTFHIDGTPLPEKMICQAEQKFIRHGFYSLLL